MQLSLDRPPKRKFNKVHFVEFKLGGCTLLNSSLGPAERGCTLLNLGLVLVEGGCTLFEFKLGGVHFVEFKLGAG